MFIYFLPSATGVDDYTGYDAQEAKKRAKAEADLTLAMGFGPVTASYTSGETAAGVKANEKEAEKDKSSE